MKTTEYTIYDTGTGAVIQTGTVPETQYESMSQVVEEGQAIIPRRADFRTQRVNAKGAVIRRRKKDMLDEERAKKWGQFRLRRAAVLDRHQYQLSPSYPMDPIKRAKLNAMYEQSRDIPEKTNDPDEAMQMLDQIWSAWDI